MAEMYGTAQTVGSDTDKRGAILMKRLSTLQKHRANWESHWQEVADYIIPRKADITKKRTSGDKRTELIFDGTAIHAAELMSASLHGMLTNAASPWFALRYTDNEFEEDDEANEWLHKASDVMYREIARSNFHEAIHELYTDLVCFGTGVLFIDHDKDDRLRFSTRHISECYLAEDEMGRVDTVYREFKISARAAVKQFGFENVGKNIAKIYKADPNEEIKLLHIVMPRDERDPVMLDSKNKPYASIYMDPEEKVILSESGYDEFPYCVPRYLKSSFENQGYGRSVAMSALSDVKMVNKMSEVVIRAAQLHIHPPLMVPDDGFHMPVRTVPGGLNFYRSGSRDRIEPLNIGGNNPIGQEQLEQRRQAIRAAFYVDQLIMGNNPNMTATEVIQRTEEKMRLLSPALGRMQAELLHPLINRIFALLSKKKAFEAAPEFMQTGEIDIEYVSPMAKAQRSSDVQSAMQLFGFLQPLMQIDPSVIDYLDIDGLASHIIKVTNVPATVVRGKGDVESLRQQRAEQQEQQAEMQQTMQTAEAAGNAAPALRAIDSVSPETQEGLGEILSGLGAAE
tara:strand:+ start:705 stop:2408 length:1704 start_codon:yes stop_codon:yes gene_type:complete